MGQQTNKFQKRRRRELYFKRKKAGLKKKLKPATASPTTPE